MLQTQNDTYGDILDNSSMHPLMWPHKGHYYVNGLTFYNFPYTFGYLIFCLNSTFRNSPDNFPRRYTDLLSRTGMSSAENLAKDFGIELEEVNFWHTSLFISIKRVGVLERLVGSL
jgi:oligoendopeptidase F